MAELSASAYDAKYTDPIMGLLKDNTNREIVPQRHRLQVTDTKDSFLNLVSYFGSYIRQADAFGTNTYTATTAMSTSTALSTGAIYLLFFENSSTAASQITINGFTRKLYINPTTQAGNGDITEAVPTLWVVDEELDTGAGGLLMISGGTSSGAGVTDGDKTGVQVSAGGTVWLPSDVVNATVSTAGSTITLPLNSKERGFFTGLTSFATPKDVVWTGDTRTLQWTFMFEITDLAATLDFGPDTRAPSTMTAGLFVGGVFTAGDIGAHKVVATRRYDDIWWLDFKGVYSVGDAPPEPADHWVLSTGIWNDSEFWDDSAIWKD